MTSRLPDFAKASAAKARLSDNYFLNSSLFNNIAKNLFSDHFILQK
jgi:hypothetical protein